ncbi:MAG: type I methionyl aminopeptidase [Bacillota bacterium]|jgi:methionyl aminopeptidase|nr:type I methionyl aminopeptidase [Candidatus Fermentithermobacillaceae bacterium]
MIILKTDEEIAIMAKAGQIARECLLRLGAMVRPGIRTIELDRAAEEFIRSKGALPTFKGLYGFPATICTSKNEVVVHGVPGDTVLEEGDIIAIDVGATYQGFVGDTAATFPVGKVSPEALKLIDVTREALERGIEQAVVGVHVGDIGHAIEGYVKQHGFSVVKDYAGHGVGRSMHESPTVPNFGRPGRGPVLRKGMVIAIEPMVNAGRSEVVTFPDMHVVTRDGSWSAHFEHTVAITEKGPVRLTVV